MKLAAIATLACATCLFSATARADDAPVHRSRSAHTAGVALTVTGVTFYGLGGLASAGAIYTLVGGFGNEGWGSLVGAALLGMVAGGCVVVGTATFVPGILLMNANSAPKQPEWTAHGMPAPAFTTVPLLSGTF